MVKSARPERASAGRRSLASGSFTRPSDKENGRVIIHHHATLSSLPRTLHHSTKPFKLTTTMGGSSSSRSVMSAAPHHTRGANGASVDGSSKLLRKYLQQQQPSPEPLTPSSSAQQQQQPLALSGTTVRPSSSGGRFVPFVVGNGHRRKTHPAPFVVVPATRASSSPSPPPIETLCLTSTPATISSPQNNTTIDQNESFQTTTSSASTSSNSFLDEAMLDSSLLNASSTSPQQCYRPDCMDPVAWTLLYKDGREDVDFLQRVDRSRNSRRGRHHHRASSRSSPTMIVRAQPPSNLTIKPRARRAVCRPNKQSTITIVLSSPSS